MEMTRVDDLGSALAGSECVIVATDHSAFNWTQISLAASLIVDTRHVITTDKAR
jgi:UDP-N-acetyl-D-mannosaminuronate dehydrogenase